VENDLIHADGQTDKMKPIGTFCEYVNVLGQYRKKIIQIKSQRNKTCFTDNMGKQI